MTFESVHKKKFSVAVIATMSSGKSTTINAMLGLPLLPSMNEACTATVCKIEDIDGLDNIRARYVTKTGEKSLWEEITSKEKKLEEWNDLGFESIEIQGDFPHIDNHKSIISFIDTPGPNNSSDKSHSEITHNIISNSKFGFVLCIMNASQFGVDDERILLTNMLGYLRNKFQEEKIVFAINKIDQLDIESGESPKLLIEKINNYLQEIGYNKPIIIPIMSLISLEIRELINAHKKNSELPFSSRMQKRVLRQIESLLEFSSDYEDASLNAPLQHQYLKRARNKNRKIDENEIINLADSDIPIRKLIEADIITGIPLLEEMLELELLKSDESLEPNRTKKLKVKYKNKNKIKVKNKKSKKSKK